jgi:hypothetical protein
VTKNDDYLSSVNTDYKGKGKAKVSDLTPTQKWNQYSHATYNHSSKSFISSNSREDYYFSPSDLGLNIHTPKSNLETPNPTAETSNNNVNSYYPYPDVWYDDYIRALQNGSVGTSRSSQEFVTPKAPSLGNLSTPSNLSNLTPLFNEAEGRPSREQSIYQEDWRSSIYTNDTNHGTVATRPGYSSLSPQESRPVYSVNWDERRQPIQRKLLEVDPTSRYVTQEVDLPSKSKGKFKLGFRLLDNSLDKVNKVYVKYHDITKRKLVWNLWEKERGYYAEFKADFYPKSQVLAEKKRKRIFLKNLLRTDPFDRARIENQDVRRIGVSSTQAELNRLNAAKYNAEDLQDPKIKPKRIRNK